MKTILKASILASMFILASCSHHSCHSCKGSQCEMQGKEQCPMSKEQCPMKKDQKSETAAPAQAPAKK